jgi:TPR repeat protein
MLLEGPIARDPVAAFGWFDRAAKEGNAEAKRQLEALEQSAAFKAALYAETDTGVRPNAIGSDTTPNVDLD